MHSLFSSSKKKKRVSAAVTVTSTKASPTEVEPYKSSRSNSSSSRSHDKHSFSAGDDGVATLVVHHSPNPPTRTRHGSASAGDLVSDASPPAPQPPSTKHRSHRNGASSSTNSHHHHHQHPPTERQPSVREKAGEYAMPPLLPSTTAPPALSSHRDSRSVSSVKDATSTHSARARGQLAAEPLAVAALSSPRDADKGMVQLPAVDSLHPLRVRRHSSGSLTHPPGNQKCSSPVSRSVTASCSPATLQPVLPSPSAKQPTVSQLVPSDIHATRASSVHSLAPLPGSSSQTPHKGFPDRTAVPSPPGSATAGAPKDPPSSRSRPRAATVASPASTTPSAPPPPLPPPTPAATAPAAPASAATSAVAAAVAQDTPSPAFTAMETVPKRRGSSFRVLKRRKNSADVSDSATSATASPDTNDNGLSNGTTVAAAMAAGGGDGGGGANTGDASPTDRHASSERARSSGGAQGKRREPVAGFAESVESSPHLPKNAPSGVVHAVPTPPPMSSDNLNALRGAAGTAQKRTRRANSIHSNHSTSSNYSTYSTADDTASLDNIVSVRRSWRAGVRLTTPRTGSRAANNSSLSLDDVPRPLTRHASTLSTEQQEALRRTPSFLSRTHTPPPLSLKESVEMHRGRRVQQMRCITPDAQGLPSALLSASERSLSTSSAMLLSDMLPSSSEDGRAAVLLSTRSSDHGTAASGRDKDGGGSRCASDSPSTTSSANASPRGPAAPNSRRGSRHTVRAAEWRANGAKPLQDSSGVSDVPRPPTSEALKASPAQPRIPSPPLPRHRLTPEVRPHAFSPPRLSTSPEPVVKTFPASVPAALRTAAAAPAGSTTPVPPASQELQKMPSPSMSLFLDDASSFDFYGSYMLSAPDFSAKPPPRRFSTSPAPAGENPKTTAIDDDARSEQLTPPRRQKPQTPHGAHVSPTTDAPPDTGAADAAGAARAAKKRADVSISVSGSIAHIIADLPDVATASEEATTTPASTQKTEPLASPATPRLIIVPPASARTVQPASRQRVVNACVDDDEDGFFQMAPTIHVTSSASLDPPGTVHGRTSLPSAALSTNGYDYFTSSPKGTKSSASFSEAAAAPAQAAAPARSQIDLYSDDDDDNDGEDGEDGEGYDDTLLEGFRPAGFDARRGTRRGSSIVFYLDKEDSLSSLDLVVKVAGDARGTGALPSPLIGHKPLPPNPQLQSEYSMLKLGAAVAPDGAGGGGGGARPRVTLDPYVPEDAQPPAEQSPSVPSSVRPTSRTNKSLVSSSNLDPYGFAMDSVSLVLQPASNMRGSRVLPSAPAGPGGASGKAVTEGPSSIFLGTTARFAPDQSKMHRPLANTFGYTAAQRRARAAAMAAGVSAEEWAHAAGVDEDAVDNEDGLYGEVYTDENGDEWYWEEVEDEEDEEVEYDEEEEEEEEDAAEAARDLDKSGTPSSTRTSAATAAAR
ncbi:hypothetical protein NESM_000841600 [Novymonas esmeraldas]|uniref:Proteophosphoglycan ppg4 n=1 Tax=Novymonas esmeraldas TaxID=1808958 RepID=A0AAW0EYY2_9TRYP